MLNLDVLFQVGVVDQHWPATHGLGVEQLEQLAVGRGHLPGKGKNFPHECRPPIRYVLLPPFCPFVVVPCADRLRGGVAFFSASAATISAVAWRCWTFGGSVDWAPSAVCPNAGFSGGAIFRRTSIASMMRRNSSLSPSSSCHGSMVGTNARMNSEPDCRLIRFVS